MKADKKLRHLRAEKGWTKSEAARAGGIPISSYRNYEKENLKELPGKTAMSLARAYGVTVEYLLNDSKDFPPNPEDRMPKEGVAGGLPKVRHGEFLGGPPKEEATGKTGATAQTPGGRTTQTRLPGFIVTLQNIPVVGYVAAGETEIAYDDAGLPVGGSIDEPLERLPDVTDEHAYGLTVSGNSMLPGYPRGTKVVVCPSEKVRSGDLVICRLRSTGKVYIKEIAFVGSGPAASSGMVVLKSHNTTAHEPMVVPREDILFCHKVVWTKRP
ncbi:MAG: XRE family transcriptional regulator [Candidatus Brocadiaceae bacterium]|nr:XRE family transcriptional regulator [Candidatus Brocadiaceae bacterium]